MSRPESMVRAQAAYVNRKLTYINAIKAKGCIDCGRSDGPIACYEFDHRPGTLKLFDISRYQAVGWVALLAEIDKCDLRCVWCHRQITEIRAGRYKETSMPIPTPKWI